VQEEGLECEEGAYEATPDLFPKRTSALLSTQATVLRRRLAAC